MNEIRVSDETMHLEDYPREKTSESSYFASKVSYTSHLMETKGKFSTLSYNSCKGNTFTKVMFQGLDSDNFINTE